MGKLIDLISRLRKPPPLHDDIEREFDRLDMSERERDQLRRVWGKNVEAKTEFPVCTACKTTYDPDYKPPELPAPDAGRCALCVPKTNGGGPGGG